MRVESNELSSADKRFLPVPTADKKQSTNSLTFRKFGDT